jgi:hypothetical protein
MTGHPIINTMNSMTDRLKDRTERVSTGRKSDGHSSSLTLIESDK